MEDDRQRRDVVTAFDEPEIANVHLRTLGQSFLRPASAFAKATNRSAEHLSFGTARLSS